VEVERSRKGQKRTGGTGKALATLLNLPDLSVHPVSPPQSTQGWLLPTLTPIWMVGRRVDVSSPRFEGGRFFSWAMDVMVRSTEWIALPIFDLTWIEFKYLHFSRESLVNYSFSGSFSPFGRSVKALQKIGLFYGPVARDQNPNHSRGPLTSCQTASRAS
jgi:hypothetical protein